MRNLKYPFELLQQIAAGVNRLNKTPVGLIQITFVNGKGERWEFGLPHALDAIANDLYWDEAGDWSDARIVKVDVY